MNVPLPLAIAAALAVSAIAPAQEPPAPLTLDAVREKLAGTRTARSADGLTTVAVPAALSGSDALTLCRFAGDVRARLSTLIDTPLDSEDYATDIVVRDLPDGGEPFVACSVAESGLRRIHVVIGGVDKVRPEAVTVALCGGFLRANAMATGWTSRGRDEFAREDSGTAPYPAWMRLGAARLLDQSARQDDAERAIARLESGGLPPIATLLAAEGSPADSDPALAAQLVAWLLDDSPRNARFRAVRDCALKSGAWNAAAAFALVAETDDPAPADAAWRTWLDRRKWSILTPGSSHPAFVRRLRGLLELYPPPPRPAPATSAETQTNATDAVSGEAPEITPQPEILAKIPSSAFEMCGGVITPAAVFLHAEEKWAPHAAMALSGRIQRIAAGHGDDVLAVAQAYGQFFAAVYAHEPRRELARRLALADDLLRIVEGDGASSDAPFPSEQNQPPPN